MLERHKLLMGRTQDRAGQNNGSIGVFWRSFNGIIGHIRYMFRGLKITHNHEHSSLYSCRGPLKSFSCRIVFFHTFTIGKFTVHVAIYSRLGPLAAMAMMQPDRRASCSPPPCLLPV